MKQFIQVNVYGKKLIKANLKTIAREAADYLKNCLCIETKSTTAYIVKKSTHIEVYVINAGKFMSTGREGRETPSFAPFISNKNSDPIIHIIIKVIDESEQLNEYWKNNTTWEVNLL